MKNVPVVPVLVAWAVLLMVTATVTAQQAIPTIPQSDVGAHVGKVATVCGLIVSISCHGEDRRVRFDMDDPYWGGGTSLVVAEADRPRLGPRLGRFLLQPLCGSGKVERHEGGFLLETKPDDMRQKGPASKVPAGFEGEGYTACDEGVTMPTLVREVKPQYTVEAMYAKKQGKVLLGAVVLPDGRVGDVVVAISLDRHDGLDGQAVAAVKQWRFKPGTLRGQPVPVMVSVEIEFNLRDKK
jgi:TonB family protein